MGVSHCRHDWISHSNILVSQCGIIVSHCISNHTCLIHRNETVEMQKKA